MKRHLSCFALVVACQVALSAEAESTSAPASPLVAPGAVLEKLADTFSFTEGPTSDAQGNVYFTDQNNNRILKWSIEGKLSTFLEPSGRANGMCFDGQGQLIACADDKNELWSIAPDGKVTVLIKDYQSKLLNGPNDVWVHPNGSLYITDPFYKRPWWNRGAMEADGQHVYWLSADHKELKRVANDLKQPNGITGTPDGKTLYVSDIGAKRTYGYDVQADGSLKRKHLICEMGSDGMTIDTDGNLYLTGKGVSVFNREGKLIDHIEVPEPWTANVSFGGPDHQTLFITASKCLYSLKLKQKGANPAK